MATADAMKIVEYVPLTMPTSIVNAKPSSTSPPNRYSASTARNVVPAVMIVRLSVWLTLVVDDLLERLAPHQCAEFSRTRSKTTIVSFTE